MGWCQYVGKRDTLNSVFILYKAPYHYYGKYTLTLITCRKVNWLHAGSTPVLPTKIKTNSSYPETEVQGRALIYWKIEGMFLFLNCLVRLIGKPNDL